MAITFVLPALTEKDQNNNSILAQLIAIDSESIRYLRVNDTVSINDLEAQAVALRAQLVE